jgi:hypothetical protein
VPERVGGGGDPRQDARQVCEDLGVREADHPDAMLLQDCGAGCITLHPCIVNRAVDLHRQACLGAEEIEHEAFDRVLPAKPEPAELPLSQVEPQYLLRGCGLSPLSSSGREAPRGKPRFAGDSLTCPTSGCGAVW